jgi:hypothetical protein
MRNRWLKAPGGVKVLSTPQTRAKYGNKRTNGYASAREAKRAAELKLLEKAGEIVELQEQFKYPLIDKDQLGRAISYVADFTYGEKQSDGSLKLVVEDVKGFKTPVYKLKRRMLFAKYGVEIRET